MRRSHWESPWPRRRTSPDAARPAHPTADTTKPQGLWHLRTGAWRSQEMRRRTGGRRDPAHARVTRARVHADGSLCGRTAREADVRGCASARSARRSRPGTGRTQRSWFPKTPSLLHKRRAKPRLSRYRVAPPQPCYSARPCATSIARSKHRLSFRTVRTRSCVNIPATYPNTKPRPTAYRRHHSCSTIAVRSRDRARHQAQTPPQTPHRHASTRIDTHRHG